MQRGNYTVSGPVMRPTYNIFVPACRERLILSKIQKSKHSFSFFSRPNTYFCLLAYIKKIF